MKPIIDSSMTLEEALQGINIPDRIKINLNLIDVQYFSFDNKLHQGQLVIHSKVVNEVVEIFEKIRELQFPILKVIPVSIYKWSDEVSMANNNTSAFNYRFIFGTERLSNHSYGLAIDINPLLNPYTQIDGIIVPRGGIYDVNKIGTITADSKIVELFKSHGWQWGGNWERKDWQHFDKNL